MIMQKQVILAKDGNANLGPEVDDECDYYYNSNVR